MAAYNKFNSFVQDLGRALINLNSDTLMLALFNVTPNAADIKYNSTAGPPAQVQATSNTVEVAAGNGYAAGGTAIGTTAYSQAAGLATLTGGNVVFTAAGGAIGPFRYIVCYDATSGTTSTRSVVGWWDYGSSISLNSGETLTVNLSGGILTLQ